MGSQKLIVITHTRPYRHCQIRLELTGGFQQKPLGNPSNTAASRDQLLLCGEIDRTVNEINQRVVNVKMLIHALDAPRFGPIMVTVIPRLAYGLSGPLQVTA